MDIIHTKGDTFIRDFLFKEKEGPVINLTGSVITMTIKKRLSDSIPMVQEVADLINPVAGVAKITIEGSRMNLKPGTYFFDYQWIDASQTVRTFDFGAFTIVPDVTSNS